MSDLKASASARLGELIRDATPPHSRQAHLEGRARLIASVERMRGHRVRFTGLALGLAAAAAAVTVILVRRHASLPVAWHVEGGTVEAHGYVSVPATGVSARLVFDDGSDVSLEPGSRGRVESTTPNGADVVIEQGRARVHVQHRDHTVWTIDAGPYAVHVTGTDFVVGWAADTETLDIWMRSGRVVVTGPVVGDELALSTGEHLTAKPTDRTSRVDAVAEPSNAPQGATGAPQDSATGNPGSAPVAPVGANTGGAVAPDTGGTAATGGALAQDVGRVTSAATRSPLPARSWAKLVTAGDYAGVLREAEGMGIGLVLSTRPLADLRALGDAARYAGRPDIARRAYGTLRERFASTPEARTAAFLLGRVAEEQDHANAEALRWYDAYFTEAPAGAFAEDALGRKMILVSRTQGRDAARPLAQRYLVRFPSGTYSAAARDLAP